MDVNAIPTGTSGATADGKAAGAQTKLSNDFSTFMTLLTTQLQNQDPMDPMDSGEFTQQLVAFSGVEQQIATNKNLENLANLTQMNNMAGAASFLSHEARISGSTATLDGGDAEWDYTISTPADSVALEVLDSGGKTIYRAGGNERLGNHAFKWDGTALDGSKLSEGTFSLRITAKNEAGENLSVPIFVTDRIRAVDTQGDVPIFEVGANKVSQADILALAASAYN